MKRLIHGEYGADAGRVKVARSYIWRRDSWKTPNCFEVIPPPDLVKYSNPGELDSKLMSDYIRIEAVTLDLDVCQTRFSTVNSAYTGVAFFNAPVKVDCVVSQQTEENELKNIYDVRPIHVLPRTTKNFGGVVSTDMIDVLSPFDAPLRRADKKFSKLVGSSIHVVPERLSGASDIASASRLQITKAWLMDEVVQISDSADTTVPWTKFYGKIPVITLRFMPNHGAAFTQVPNNNGGDWFQGLIQGVVTWYYKDVGSNKLINHL